jgi:hypothetical protein
MLGNTKLDGPSCTEIWNSLKNVSVTPVISILRSKKVADFKTQRSKLACLSFVMYGKVDGKITVHMCIYGKGKGKVIPVL